MPDRWRSPVPDDWPRLVDAHCHPVLTGDLTDEAFAGLMGAGQALESMSTVALRRWCAPVLDLDAHAALDAYLARRRELGAAEVNRRLLSRAGVGDLVLDEPEGTDLEATLTAADARGHRVVRLEDLAAGLLAQVDPPALADAVRSELSRTDAVAAVTLAGVRSPSVGGAANGPMLGARPLADSSLGDLVGTTEPEERADDPRWHTWLAFAALEAGLPLQVPLGHVLAPGRPIFGDPLALRPFLEATESLGAPVILINSYPHHEIAAVLARSYAHVHLDIGRVMRAGGDLSARVVAEVLLAAPFGRLVYSSDGYGLAEHHYLAAVLFRRGLGTVLHDLVVRDEIDRATSDRLTRAVSRDNAVRAFGLGETD
ncbi:MULTISPECIES: amidohydrolase [Mumia]|uniref:amidohydrolase n=1 Tax=Mumia TaxID=1546255 RepID=UPI00141F9EDC|nr:MULTISPECIES: amidohydrolase [unclassified Mumia]QMW64830.1 amidohydrolase [Mumia sp. ZJ1417]